MQSKKTNKYLSFLRNNKSCDATAAADVRWFFITTTNTSKNDKREEGEEITKHICIIK
jgi:hypothetical protein